MTVAIPVVKPVVTGYGMNLIRVPSRNAPMAMRRTPAMNPAVSRPASPCLETMGARMTTNAAVGPVTWNLQPPRSDTERPAKIAV